jgi:hypothetical protein
MDSGAAGSRTRLTHHARAWAAPLFAAVCAWWYWKRCWLAQIPDGGPSDFKFYYLAAQHVLHGRSPFFEGGYIYPPLLACVLAPLARLNYLTARWVWFAFSHAALLLAAYLLWRHLGRDRVALAVIAFVWAAGGAAEDGLGIGQVDSVLLLMMVLAMTGTGGVEAAAVAAGFGLKLFPGLLAALPALQRNWRRLVVAAAGGGMLLAAPWALVAFALTGPKAPPRVDYLAGTPCLLSWSLPSLALRAIDSPGPRGGIPSDWVIGYDLPNLHHSAAQRVLSLGVAAGTLLAGLLALYRAAAGRIGRTERMAAGAALMSLALVASPICWWHYQVLQYPGAAIVLVAALRPLRPWLFCGALLDAAFLFPVPAAVLRFYYHQHERWPDFPATLCFWTAVPAAATMVLFALLTASLRHQRRGGGRTAPGGAGTRQATMSPFM